MTGLFTACLAVVIVFFRHSVTSHMAGLCLTSAIMVMTDVFLFTRYNCLSTHSTSHDSEEVPLVHRYAATLEKSMVSVERLQQYSDIQQESVCAHDRLPLPPASRNTKGSGQVVFNR